MAQKPTLSRDTNIQNSEINRSNTDSLSSICDTSKQLSVKWDSDLINHYNTSGPRYTSYPTALQFNEPFSKNQYLQALEANDTPDKPLSLYVHIPFCSHICYYCACNKVITKRRDKAQPYLNALYSEMAHRSTAYNGNRQVEQLHWGGGTPTFVSEDQMAELMGVIGDYFNLSNSHARDFSIEIDPRELHRNTLTHLRKLGFNRVSLGVQDFNGKVQKAVNRIQPYDMTLNALNEARRLGFRSINIDLIYGLPYQKRDSFRKTLEQVVALDPDRLSIFNYAHLPERFMPQRRISTEDLPPAIEKLTMLEDSINMLTQAGYHYVGMDHFAKPNDSLSIAQAQEQLHRNFQGYTTHPDTDLIALGVSAISQIGDTYFQNHSDINHYINDINSGALAISKGVHLTQEDIIRRATIKQLICHFNLKFAWLRSEFDIEPQEYFAQALINLKPHVADGLLTLCDKGIEVTVKGRLLIRNICMQFDAYIPEFKNSLRYSKVI